MPIYEYQCFQCGRIEEILQKVSDKPLKRCPKCSGRLHKLISQSSFQLKGTGWYVTDYASKAQKSPAKKPDKTQKSAADTPTSTSNKKNSKNPSE
jgi:putative FmdB family regulatory protein